MEVPATPQDILATNLGPMVSTPIGRPLNPNVAYNAYVERQDKVRFSNLMVGLGLKKPITQGPAPNIQELRKIALQNFKTFRPVSMRLWIEQQRAKGQNFTNTFVSQLGGR